METRSYHLSALTYVLRGGSSVEQQQVRVPIAAPLHLEPVWELFGVGAGDWKKDPRTASLVALPELESRLLFYSLRKPSFLRTMSYSFIGYLSLTFPFLRC